MNNLYELYYQYVRSQEELGYPICSYETWLDYVQAELHQ
ncbi:hypothetical protein [Burkholderia phage vB_BpP_HN03]